MSHVSQLDFGNFPSVRLLYELPGLVDVLLDAVVVGPLSLHLDAEVQAAAICLRVACEGLPSRDGRHEIFVFHHHVKFHFCISRPKRLNTDVRVLGGHKIVSNSIEVDVGDVQMLGLENLLVVPTF